MGGNRETFGVGLAFVGFVVIVLGFKGTWGKVWHDLFTGAGIDTTDPGGSGGTAGPATSDGGTSITQGPGGTWLVPADPNAPTTRLPASLPIGGTSIYTSFSPGLPNTRVQTPSYLLT
jgi:hypothetical protein